MSGGSHANSVSDGTTRFHSLLSVFFPRFATDSCAMRTACEKLRSHGVHSGLGNTQAPSCLASSLIGCAVDAIDVQLGLETDLHPDAPFVDQKTRGAARYPKKPARDGYCHGT